MKYIFTLLCLLILTGCSHKYSTHSKDTLTTQENIEQLAQAIIHLDTSIDKKEAYIVARISYEYPKILAQKYQLITPPLWHNTLINMNLKNKGFCYHFAQDLLKELKQHPIQTIDLKWVTHKRAQYWEHNAVLVKGKNQSYTKGIVLDAWRNSGNLYWNYLTKDTSYTWYYDSQKSKYYGN